MSQIEKVAVNDLGTKAVIRIETKDGFHQATVMTELGANRLLERFGLPLIRPTE